MSKSAERLAAAGAREALLQQRAELGHVLGREQRREPAVGDLGRERRVLRPDRRDVDRDPLLHGRDRELERLARAVGQRQLERLAVVARAARAAAPSARRRRTRACAAAGARSAGRASPPRPAGPLGPMPSSTRPPESWSSVAAVIAVIAGERPGICRIAEPSRMRSVCAGQPGEHRDRVRAVRLGGPDRVVAEPLGLARPAPAARPRRVRDPSSRCAGRASWTQSASPGR